MFVGDRVLVNPSVRQVLDAMTAIDPDYRPPSPSAASRTGGRSPTTTPSQGLGWLLVVAALWFVLLVWRPTTTWHLLPLILAAAWPWVVGQDTSPGDPSARRRIRLAGVGGLGAAFALTGILSAAGRLDGPAWTGSGGPAVEALLLSLGGAAGATALGLLRTVRRTTSGSARLGDSQVAASGDVVRVEGNPYFPLTSVAEGVLQPSDTTSLCPWKGVESYYDVHVDGQVVPDGAFTYRHPTPLARRIKGRVAFGQRIESDTTRPGRG
ncbi:MAG: DUF427 domain-containing protein [Nocardioides sp.]|nr:DUF427 domain-containing protein [Nocardioides sp.]